MWWLLLGCVASLPPGVDDKDDVPPVVDTDTPAPDDTDVYETGYDDPVPRVRFTDVPEDAEAGGPAALKGVVRTRDHDPEDLLLTMSSDRDGPLTPPTVAADGTFTWPVAGLSAGWHQLTLRATDPRGRTGEAVIELGLCAWPPFVDFATDVIGNGWTRYGDAAWDPGGWLEITGIETWRRGGLFWTARKVNPGDFELSFRIATGGGLGTGADGFAVSVIDAPDPTALRALIDAAAAGGCLAYGTAPPCGQTAMNAFHVEFDTWYNVNTPITDPTPDNHVAVHLDGDAGNPRLWAAIPNLEDLQWRQVRVAASGTRVTVDVNGTRVIDGDIPGFTFDGGYLGVTGSTGAETNWHRFDDLSLRDRCAIPD